MLRRLRTQLAAAEAAPLPRRLTFTVPRSVAAAAAEAEARYAALAASLRETACTDAEAEALRGSGGPPSDPSRTFDGGLDEPAADEAAGSDSGSDGDGGGGDGGGE